MTQYTNAEYKVQTATLFPTNGIGAITAEDLRTQLDNTADSVPFKTTGATAAPTVNDDGANTSGNGAIEIGDIWIDETNDVSYICLDNTTGAAIWASMASGSGDVTVSGTPANNQIGVWVSATSQEGDANLTWNGSTLNVAGNITVTGTVDGRDVATDGTKLDGIETGATADQTGAEIKALYEVEANAFTDAQFTKLAGIETSATADQTGAEIVAAIDSELGSAVWQGGASVFTDLSDVPGAYAGAGGRTVKVNSGATALEFVDEGGAIVAVGSSRSFALTDVKDILEVTTASPIILTIDPDSTTDIPIGTLIGITLLNIADTLTIQADTGVTLNGVSAGGCNVDATAFAGVTLYKRDADAWVIQGQHGTVS